MAWALGKLSHFHQGLLDAIAAQAAAMIHVGSLLPTLLYSSVRAFWRYTSIESSNSK